MRLPRLLDSLPELVREGLIDNDQADRIRARYAAPSDQESNRMTLLFSVLGGLLIGLGVILVVAHNWDDLSKTARTVFAFLPMAIGQGLVLFTLLRKRAHQGWKEGTSVFLMLSVGACLAMVSQIYHIPGKLDGFLLVWCLLTVALLYVPGSLICTLLYLCMITWYAGAVRTENWRFDNLPWPYLPLLALAVPVYIRTWRTQGTSVGFFWLNAVLAISIGIVSQFFWKNNHMEIAIAIAGLACAYCLVPWFHKHRNLRTGAFPSIGGAAMLCVLFFLSYHDVWKELYQPYHRIGEDLWPMLALLAIGCVTYGLSLRHRKPGEGTWLPESMCVILLAYLSSTVSFSLATVFVNAWLLALGLNAVITGLRNDSLPRMNLGLAILSLTIVLRFFDLDINDALKGMVFIALGAGFLMMNLRLLQQRKRSGHA